MTVYMHYYYFRTASSYCLRGVAHSIRTESMAYVINCDALSVGVVMHDLLCCVDI